LKAEVPVEVMAPLAMVPIPERLPLLNPQEPLKLPSVKVLVPKSRVVALTVVPLTVVPVTVAPVMVPSVVKLSEEETKG